MTKKIVALLLAVMMLSVSALAVVATPSRTVFTVPMASKGVVTFIEAEDRSLTRDFAEKIAKAEGKKIADICSVFVTGYTDGEEVVTATTALKFTADDEAVAVVGLGNGEYATLPTTTNEDGTLAITFTADVLADLNGTGYHTFVILYK